MNFLKFKYGFYIHFFLGMFFLLGCYTVALADPVSGFLVSLAISAAVSAGTAVATWGISKILAPLETSFSGWLIATFKPLRISAEILEMV